MLKHVRGYQLFLTQDLAALLEAVVEYNGILVLSLTDCGLNDRNSEALFRAIRTGFTLTTLRLRYVHDRNRALLCSVVASTATTAWGIWVPASWPMHYL